MALFTPKEHTAADLAVEYEQALDAFNQARQSVYDSARERDSVIEARLQQLEQEQKELTSLQAAIERAGRQV